jgi:hypothetical protein
MRNNSFFSLKKTLTGGASLLLFLLLYLLLFTHTFAYNADSGTIYEKVMKKIFIELPSDELNTELQNYTVHQSHALADENSNEVMWGKGDENGKKQVLIGSQETSSDTLKLEAENAEIKLTSDSGNSELSLGDTKGDHGSLYFDSNSSELRIWNKENAVVISSSGVDFPKGLHINNDPVVTSFDCGQTEEGVQKFLQGFNEAGEAICATTEGASFSKSTWVSAPISECSGGFIDYNVVCATKEKKYYDIVGDDVCISLGLPEPERRRACN